MRDYPAPVTPVRDSGSAPRDGSASRRRKGVAQPLPSGQPGRMAALPSGTVTLLFTDIEGSTRLWESQPVQMHAALVRHDLLVRSAVEAAGGYVFKTVGDAFCVAFPTAASGSRVRCTRNTHSLGRAGPNTRRSRPGWRCIPASALNATATTSVRRSTGSRVSKRSDTADRCCCRAPRSPCSVTTDPKACSCATWASTG